MDVLQWLGFRGRGLVERRNVTTDGEAERVGGRFRLTRFTPMALDVVGRVNRASPADKKGSNRDG